MAPDSLVQRQGACREPGDRKQRQEHAGRGRGNLVDAGGENRRDAVTAAEGIPTPTVAAGLHSEIEWKAEATRYSDDEGSRDAGTPPARARPGIRDHSR